MIRQCFSFLEGISKKTETNLKEQGIKDWHDFLKTTQIKGIGKKRKAYYQSQILKAKEALYTFNTNFFYKKLKPVEGYKLYNFFNDECLFLDIETTGVKKQDELLVIGLYDGIKTKTMIKGINLDLEALKEELKKYKLIVTFNGASFDIPFLKKRYPNLIPNIPHFDLKAATKRIGLKGGLKEIETHLGIKRKDIIKRIAGGDPKLLYRMFRGSGDDYYLNLLVEYNEEDVISLKKIADVVYEKLNCNNNLTVVKIF